MYVSPAAKMVSVSELTKIKLGGYWTIRSLMKSLMLPQPESIITPK